MSRRVQRNKPITAVSCWCSLLAATPGTQCTNSSLGAAHSFGGESQRHRQGGAVQVNTGDKGGQNGGQCARYLCAGGLTSGTVIAQVDPIRVQLGPHRGFYSILSVLSTH